MKFFFAGSLSLPYLVFPSSCSSSVPDFILLMAFWTRIIYEYSRWSWAPLFILMLCHVFICRKDCFYLCALACTFLYMISDPYPASCPHWSVPSFTWSRIRKIRYVPIGPYPSFIDLFRVIPYLHIGPYLRFLWFDLGNFLICTLACTFAFFDLLQPLFLPVHRSVPSFTWSLIRVVCYGPIGLYLLFCCFVSLLFVYVCIINRLFLFVNTFFRNFSTFFLFIQNCMKYHQIVHTIHAINT